MRVFRPRLRRSLRARPGVGLFPRPSRRNEVPPDHTSVRDDLERQMAALDLPGVDALPGAGRRRTERRARARARDGAGNRLLLPESVSHEATALDLEGVEEVVTPRPNEFLRDAVRRC